MKITSNYHKRPFLFGYEGESAFSGVLIHIDDDDTETYVIGWCLD